MKLAIFYHIAQMGMGAFIYQQQIHRLYVSGLIEAADHIHFGVNGNQELFNVPEKVKVLYNKKENWGSEKETLQALKTFCNENEDYKVLYFHTKGASKDTLGSQSWRLMMEYFVLDRWEECVSALSTYSGSSCALSIDVPHFIGNFWWANASYIQTLKMDLLNTEDRYDCENWIGTGDDFNPHTFHILKVDGNSLYWKVYPETNYIK